MFKNINLTTTLFVKQIYYATTLKKTDLTFLNGSPNLL